MIRLNEKLLESTVVNYVNNQEVPTNEYIDNKRIYTKRFESTSLLNWETKIVIPHGVTDYDLMWIDVSNSYVIVYQGTNNIGSYPIVSTLSDVNSPSTVQARIKESNIEIYAGGGWGNVWKKVVTIKYTKK